MTTDLIKWGLDTSKLPAAVAASKEPIVRFFSWHDAHPVSLFMALMEKFKDDEDEDGEEFGEFGWIEWEPDTLKGEILKSFNATSVSPHNWEKIQAVRTLMRTVGFWSEWHIFEKIIQALNNNIPRFDITQRCTVAQLMAGIDIANQIRDESFGPEIQRYVAACALDEYVTYLPPPLDFAQRVLSQPMYRCKVCGNIDLDDIDGRCDFCCGRFSDERPLNFRPNPKLPKGSGEQVEKYLARDPTKIKARFEELKAKGVGGVKLSDESIEDVQSTKLMVAYNYMELRRGQLVDQLEELKTWVSN